MKTEMRGMKTEMLTLLRNPMSLLALKTQKILNPSILQLVGSANVTVVAANNVTVNVSATASTSGSSSASKPNAGRTGTHRKRKAKENNSTSGPKWKYSFDFLQQVFFWTGAKDAPNPHCGLCYETLVNKSMKPANLK